MQLDRKHFQTYASLPGSFLPQLGLGVFIIRDLDDLCESRVGIVKPKAIAEIDVGVGVVHSLVFPFWRWPTVLMF